MRRFARRAVLVSAAVAITGGTLLIYFLILRTSVPLPTLFIRLSVITLALFLVVLILRYIVMIWFSFLDRLETLSSREADFFPFVSIIVPAYNEAPMIAPALRSLLSLQYPAYEVIVVDDGSEDETAARAAAWTRGAAVRVIRQRNGGKSRALNAGIHAARGEIIVCMDADSHLEPGALTALVRHFRDPAVGAVAGNVKVRNRRGLLARLQALEYIEGLNLVRQAHAFFRTVNIIPGPCGAFRRETLTQVGGYDHDTFAEDCDLTLKILTAGWKILYEPRAIAWTEAPTTLRDLMSQRYRWTRGILQSLVKHARRLPRASFPLSHGAVLSYMAFESVLWPAMNVFGHSFFLGIALTYGFSSLLVYWWAQLTLLDLLAALYCVGMEEEDLSLVASSVLYRIYFILVVDVCKVFAGLEELCGVRMRWGTMTPSPARGG